MLRKPYTMICHTARRSLCCLRCDQCSLTLQGATRRDSPRHDRKNSSKEPGYTRRDQARRKDKGTKVLPVQGQDSWSESVAATCFSDPVSTDPVLLNLDPSNPGPLKSEQIQKQRRPNRQRRYHATPPRCCVREHLTTPPASSKPLPTPSFVTDPSTPPPTPSKPASNNSTLTTTPPVTTASYFTDLLPTPPPQTTPPTTPPPNAASHHEKAECADALPYRVYLHVPVGGRRCV